MQTTIKQVSPVEYELEISAKAEDLAPEIEKALRAQRAKTTLKGFRPGKVPLPIVKKMYGQALAYGIADRSVQQTYEAEVLQAGDHEVLGQPTLTTFDYALDGDLHAVIKFGVRPEITLQDVSDASITTLAFEVTDADVDEELDRLRRDNADLVPVEDEPAGPTDLVVFDLQELDAATQTPVIGKRDVDQTLMLDDPRLEENALLRALAQAVEGHRAGATVRFQFEHDQAHGDHAGAHAHGFEATIKEVKRREVPDLDDDFVQELTDGRFDEVDAFRGEVRRQLTAAWERNAREYLEGNLIEKMRELHPVPVPESVIDLFLDSFVEDVKRRNEGALPDNFPEAAFRTANRDEAEKQARWMLLRDKVIEQEGLEVAEDDLTAFFEDEAGRDGRITTEQLQQFYRAMPQMLEQVEQRLLSRKVFDALASQFQLVPKDRAAIEEEMEQRRAEDEAQAQAQAHADASARAIAAAAIPAMPPDVEDAPADED